MAYMQKILIILFLFMLSSCYEDFQLSYPREISPEIVIESVFSNDSSSVHVFVSETTSVKDTNNIFKGINDAAVFISDDLGNSVQLYLSDNGKYTADNFNKKSGSTYNLKVQVGDKIFNASDKMLECNIVDSLYVEYFENKDYYEDGYYIKSSINVQEDEKQYFRLILSVNDTMFTNYIDLMLFETSLIADQSEVIIPYVYQSGDFVTMKLYSLSEEMYRYWNAYFQITTGFLGNATSPSQNPPSNISGGCLGYFQVSSVNTYVVSIP